MKKTKFIAFSGGCFSGKTTTMKLAKKIFESNGIKVVMLDELMRDKKIVSIDEIRKNPVDYLNLQEEIIKKKIEMEKELLSRNEECIVLIDRAITDSLFYMLFYIDKSGLDYKDMLKFEKLYAYVHKYASTVFRDVYDILIEFQPLNSIACIQACDDKYRPMNLLVQRLSEHRLISTFNRAYCNDNCKCTNIYLNVSMAKENELESIFTLVSENYLKEWHGNR